MICKRCTGRGHAHYLTCPTLAWPPRSKYLRDLVVTAR